MKNCKAILAALLIGASPAARAQYLVGTNDLAHTNISAALAAFTTAVATSPNDPAANLFFAYTRLLNLPSQAPGSNFLTAWGVSTEGRDVFDWTAERQRQAHGRIAYPANENADDVTAQFRTNVLPVLAAAETNLAQITDTSFTLYLPQAVTHLGDVTVDYGDALMLRAILYAQEFAIYTVNSWNVDGTVSAISNYAGTPVLNTGAGKEGIEGVLSGFPDALTFATTNDFHAAQGAFTNAINNYLAASQFIRNRPADTTRLFNLDASDAAAEQEFRAKITDLENSLVAPVAFNGDTNHIVSMAAYFSAKNSPRSFLPEFTNNFDFVWDSVPDPTFGGLVTGFTTSNLSQMLVSKTDSGPNAELILPGINFTDLREFPDDNDSGPPNGVVQGTDGNLYGTFTYGGAASSGLIFKVAPSTGDLTTLYQFGLETNADGSSVDGGNPNDLTVGTDGNLYGTTYDGGINEGGTVFMINGKNGKLTTLWDFGTDADQGAYGSASPLVEGKDGYFYGSASQGGPIGWGIIFRLAPSVSDPNFQILYAFGTETNLEGDILDGENPNTLVQGTDGNFYGTTQSGGAYGFGTIFKLSPPGSLTNFATLYSFGTVQDEFGNPLDGNAPNALVQGTNGIFYGTTLFGGSNDINYQSFLQYGPPSYYYYGYPSYSYGNGDGTIFGISSNGSFTGLYSFDQRQYDGFTPIGAMVRGTNGNLCGTTYGGGANNRGTIFLYQPGGIPQFVVWFSKGLGGEPNPPQGLVPGTTAGEFYGTTATAHDGSGTVYRFSPGATTTITPPSIISSPASTNGLVDSEVTLTVTASGTTPLHYQWRKNGTAAADNIKGATDSSLTLDNLKLTDSGTYYVVVTNLYGSNTSAEAVLLVLQGPIITSAPKAPSGILQGDPLSLTVAATGGSLAYQWLFNATNLLTNGGAITGATSSNLVINPAYITNSGSYTVIVSNSRGSVSNKPLAVTVSKDNVKPEVAITSPAKDGTRSNAMVWTFKGTASDNVEVINVSYWITNLNGATSVLGPFAAVLSAGTGSSSNWTATNSPPAGSNVFAARSYDFSGNPSPFASRKFFVESPVPLTVAIAGSGSGKFKGTNFISGETNVPGTNSPLNVGEYYSITAYPDADSYFTGWTGSAGATNGPTLRFIMESNTSLTASFITNRFLGMEGTYSGLFTNTNGVITEESAGMISGLKLATNGVFSGVLYLDGSSPSLSGTFSPEGNWSNSVSTKLDKNVKVVLYVTNSSPRTITGWVIDTNIQTGWTSEVTLFASLTNSSDLAGRYTLLIPPVSTDLVTNPPGYGYALLTNNPGNAKTKVLPSITLGGAMADGTAISQSMFIGEDNGIAVYPSPYNTSTNGMLIGRLSLSNSPAVPGPSGTLTWIKKVTTSGSFKAGFTNNAIAVLGSPWIGSMGIMMPPGSPLVLTNGGLTPALTNYVMVSGTKLEPTNTATALDYKSGAINTNNGQMTITFTNDAKATVTGYGALLQDFQFGGGYFVSPSSNPTNFGSISLGTEP
jgi:uncharacterized repeat protein (TIGR03803 family)